MILWLAMSSAFGAVGLLLFSRLFENRPHEEAVFRLHAEHVHQGLYSLNINTDPLEPDKKITTNPAQPDNQ